jgi:glyoxylase I family protein
VGTNSVIGGGGFHHLAVKVHDFEAAVKFYTEGLGFKEKVAWGEGNSRAVMLDTGDGNYLEIFGGGSAEPTPEGAILHFALRTRDCDAAIERARKAGARVTMEPKSLEIPSKPAATPVRIAFCKAPGGEVIEFFQNERT